jgi:predicted nuclease of restriction endonuclease-like (RecB) superfamily
MQRAQATIDVRATERFLRWSLKHNQQAIDALTHQREALLAALEVVTQQASKPR